MKLLRRACLLALTVGIFFSLQTGDAEFEAIPFPGSGSMVKMTEQINSGGEYFLRLVMPIAEDDTRLEADKPTCSLLVRISGNTSPQTSYEITSFKTYAEFGFARLRLLKSNATWHLAPGKYVIEVASKRTPDEIARRGAALALDTEKTHVTERFLADQLSHLCAIILCATGLLGLIFCEVYSHYKWQR